MILYGYKFFVIDHGWDNLVKVDDFLKKTIDNKFSFHDEDIELFQEYISKITQHFKQAKVLATELGWEGDFNFGPSVFFLTDPSRNDMSFGFVFKQYNNGMTFVISPVQLEHLYEYENVETEVIEFD